MKKPINKNGIENPAIEVNVTIQEERLLKNLVEQLSNRYYDNNYSLEKVPIGWNAIETSSIESYVNGDINISTETINQAKSQLISFHKNQ